MKSRSAKEGSDSPRPQRFRVAMRAGLSSPKSRRSAPTEAQLERLTAFAETEQIYLADAPNLPTAKTERRKSIGSLFYVSALANHIAAVVYGVFHHEVSLPQSTSSAHS